MSKPKKQIRIYRNGKGAARLRDLQVKHKRSTGKNLSDADALEALAEQKPLKVSGTIN